MVAASTAPTQPDQLPRLPDDPLAALASSIVPEAVAEPEPQQVVDPVTQLTGVTDGQFYADLVRHGKAFIDQVAAFGRAVLAEVAGAHGEDPLKSLISDDDEATDVERPVSILRRTLDMMLPVMSPPMQEATVEPKREDARFEATRQKYRAEQLMQEIQFEDADREACVQSFLTGYNVRFVCPAVGILTLIANEDVDDGTPTVWPVNVVDGDYACDPAARRPQEDRMRAVRFRFSKRQAIKHGFIDAEELGKVDYADHQGDMPHEDLFYLWVVVVYGRRGIRWGMLYRPGEDDWYMPLQDWAQDGHPNGPIIVERIKPIRTTRNHAVTPAMQLGGLHMGWARLVESCTQRAIVEKTLIAMPPGTARPVQEQMLEAKHLNPIEFSGALPTTLTLGGMTPGQVAALPMLNDQINSETPNLQQSSGSKGISDTAREAMILQNNANRLLSDIAAACERARSRALEQVMFYDFYGKQTAGSMEVGITFTRTLGCQIVNTTITPADREADFFEMTFKIGTTQANQIDPAVKLDLLTKLGASLPQMIAGIAQLGGNPDPFIRDLAELSGLPALAEIFPTGSAQIIMQAKQEEAMMAQQAGIQGGADQRKAKAQGGGGGGGGPMGELASMGTLSPMAAPGVANSGATNAVA